MVYLCCHFGLAARFRRKAFRGEAERFDVIIGRDGYVHFDGAPAGSVGWCILCRTRRRLRLRLAAVEALGATATQVGDTEAAGFAPLGQVEAILRVIRVYKRRSAPTGASGGDVVQPSAGAIYSAFVGAKS